MAPTHNATQPRMSSVIPPFLGRWARAGAGRLPPTLRDALMIFHVQTQLIFSRTILLILACVFAFFTWLAIVAGIHQPNQAYDFLALQSIVMGLLTCMNLWSAESDGGTLELLMMRMRGPGHLIWFKLRVALVWMMILSFPLFAGLGWFVDLGLGRLLVFWVFSMMAALPMMLLTCVVTTFVRNGLTASVLAVVMAVPVAALTENVPLRWIRFFRLFIPPYKLLEESLPTILGNRLMWLAAVACLVWWLYNRLRRVERWIR
ncbi:MAG: hypothetical protein BWZ08_00563 [candidate division BRC1 bacterium ADurb.BinA292]|nr:MAG: hypothetical protein BWZ08_00563 [candidate division BRC1 bacterium ADurb.BinA292]